MTDIRLRSFVRYDSKGKIVPGGPILMLSKPKTGNWVEIPMYKDKFTRSSSTTKYLRAFIRYDKKLRIVAGSLVLARKSPQIGNWIEIDAHIPCLMCNNGCDAPAPLNVTVTPNAVGSNPVTWYLVAIYNYYHSGYEYVSLVSEEVSFVVGDSTTTISFDCDPLPSWANYVNYYFSTTSGQYDILGNYTVTVPHNINTTEESDISYREILRVPIWNYCTSTTTTTIYCIGDYEGVLTVGSPTLGVYGYEAGEGGFGTLNPIDSSILAIIWAFYKSFIEIVLHECYDEVIIQIDGSQYIVPFYDEMEGVYIYMLPDVDNPFPGIGEEYDIKLCYGVPCTTTTTTTICDCDYCGVMTVGTDGSEIQANIGYASGEGGFGTIDPLDNNIFWLSWNGVDSICIFIYECYDEIILYVDSIQYIIPYSNQEDNLFMYILETVNPFPAVGETCNIKLCYGTPCTTTTTTTTQ